MRFSGRSAAVVAAILTLGACQTASDPAGIRDIDPGTLMGLQPPAVIALLGEPELRRPEAPAEVWQYRSDTCVADLYLLAEEQAQPRVVYFETRHRSQGTVRAGRFLGEIAAGRGRASGPTG